MSTKLLSAAWKADVPKGPKATLIALADIANKKTCEAWPSIATLVRRTGRSKRSVQTDLQKLADWGHITREDRKGRTCLLLIHPHKESCTRAMAAPLLPFAPQQPLRGRGATVAPEPSLNPSSFQEAAEPPEKNGDPIKQVFDLGVATLVESGVQPERARSLIGHWRKAHSDGEVLNALVLCRSKAISEPIEWLQRKLKGVSYVSASGHEYHGSLAAIEREAEKRADWNTYWIVKRDREAEARANHSHDAMKLARE